MRRKMGRASLNPLRQAQGPKNITSNYSLLTYIPFDKPGDYGLTPGSVENMSKYCQDGNRTHGIVY